jgi:phage shock protein E
MTSPRRAAPLRFLLHTALSLVFGGGLFAFASARAATAAGPSTGLDQVALIALVVALWCGALTTLSERVAASNVALRVPASALLGALSLGVFGAALSFVAFGAPQTRLVLAGVAFGALMQAVRAWSTRPTEGQVNPKELIANGALVIDVRSADEWAEGHLDGARHVPLGELDDRLDEVDGWVGGDKQRPIVVYCKSGIRSARARSMLAAAGHTLVVNGGGLRDLR